MPGLFRFLFPKRKLQSKIPLLPLSWSSRDGPYPDEIDHNQEEALRAYAMIRTRQDAIRCLRRYPGLPLQQIIKKEQRQRRFKNRLKLAWRRLKDRW
jgi:hypothetical protein